MVELSLGDLLRWKPHYFRLTGSMVDQQPALEQEISWAVSIRATTPVLPPLRGDELVIVPEAVLNELSIRESIGWTNLAAHLQTLPISAVVSDHPEATAGISGITVFESPIRLSPDLELELNREFTERRSSLYQLGSDLARLFSSASIGGLDLSGFLRLASQRTGIPVALVTVTGRVLASSDRDVRPGVIAVADGTAARRTSSEGRDWLSQEVTGAGLPAGVYLLASIHPDEPGDRGRLVLEQTGEALGLIFDRLPPLDSGSPDDEMRQILETLATGRSLSSAARRRLDRLATGIDLNGQLRVVADPTGKLARSISTMPVFRVGGVDLLLVNNDHVERIWRNDATDLVISWPFRGIDGLPDAVEPVAKAVRLRESGLLAGGTVDFANPGSGGALGALLGLATSVPGAMDQLGAFADVMLLDIEAYDRSRDMQLVETLGAYLDAGATVSTASKRLRIHRNTLSYRIARITEVGGHDLADPRVRFNLQLAISIRRLQAV